MNAGVASTETKENLLQRIPPYKTLDVFRGFAALWVVMVHCCDRWLPDHWDHIRTPLYNFAVRGQIGVVLFFVISGYCITAAAYGALVTGKTTGRYAFERLRRVYPPYLAALILTVLAALINNYAAAHHWIPPINHQQVYTLDPRYWIGNLFLVQFEVDVPFVNVVMWSLCYEVAFYLLIGIFLEGSRRIKGQKNLHAATVFLVCSVGGSTMLALAVLLITGKAYFPFDLWHQFAIGGVLFFVLEMKPGTVSEYSRKFRWMVLANAAGVVGCTLLYVALRQVGVVNIGHPSSKLRSMTCLVFAGLLIWLRKHDERLAKSRVLRPMLWVGAFSYSL